MTNTAELRQRTAIAATNLDRVAADLAEAQADLTLLERIKSAPDRVTRLTAELAKATKERDRAIAGEAKAAKAKRLSGISDVNVIESHKTLNESVTRSAFTITYTRPTWDGRASMPQKHTVGGFGMLPPDVLEYLIVERPDLIPAKIMALAPDNPLLAFDRYFVSVKRGFVIG